MFEPDKVTVNVNNILAIQRHTIPSLILLSNTLRKEPVQKRKVNVHGLELPTVKLEIMNVQAVLELVEFDEPALSRGYSKVFSCEVPLAWNGEGTVHVEPFYLPFSQHGSPNPKRNRRLLTDKKTLSTRHL